MFSLNHFNSESIDKLPIRNKQVLGKRQGYFSINCLTPFCKLSFHTLYYILVSKPPGIQNKLISLFNF